jgi:RNA polymerase sigma-70 factor (ECF subfamily)
MRESREPAHGGEAFFPARFAKCSEPRDLRAIERAAGIFPTRPATIVLAPEPKRARVASKLKVFMSSPAPKKARLRLVGGQAVQGEAPKLGPANELEDPELVSLARSRHQLAFEVLYRRHAPFAINLAVRIQGSSVDVEDIVHDAFLRAQHSLEELRDGAAFRSWLGSIVVRLVRTRLRRKRLVAALGFAATEPVDLDAVASPQADPETRAQLAQIYALLRTMPSDDRIAWTLRFIERQRLEAVAQLTDCSLATAKRRIQRAQRFLSDHFVSPSAKALT